MICCRYYIADDILQINNIEDIKNLEQRNLFYFKKRFPFEVSS